MVNFIIHDPYPNSRKAWKSIKSSLINASKSLGYETHVVSSNMKLIDILSTGKSIIFCSSGRLSYYYLKKIENQLLFYVNAKRSLKIITHLAASNYTFNSFRLFEEKDLKINSNRFIFFEKITYKYYINTIKTDKRYNAIINNVSKPVHEMYLAGDDINFYHEYSKQHHCDVIFIGTAIGERRNFVNRLKKDLKNEGFKLKILGQDWTLRDRILNFILNILTIMQIKIYIKNKIDFSDERKYYSSSTICLNFHEDYQVINGYDINERFFKIELCNGLQITNNMSFIHNKIDPNFRPLMYSNYNECLKLCLKILKNNQSNKKNSSEYYATYHSWRKRLSDLLS